MITSKFFVGSRFILIGHQLTLAAARIDANEHCKVFEGENPYVEITDGTHTEVMYPVVDEGDVLPRFPFADIVATIRFFAPRRAFCHAPIVAITRHLQMAGAVDQACVERLTALWRAGRSKARVERFRVDFLHA